MNTSIFTIADAATISGGKLNMLGSFNQLSARGFPARHHDCVIICKLQLDHDDSGEHELSLHIIDPDGTDVLPPCRAKFSRSIDFGSDAEHTHLWHIHGFPMPKPGTFYIDAMIDGSLIARTPLHVRKVEPRK